MRRAAAITAVVVAGIAVPAASAGGTAERATKTKTVKVGDDFFAPASVKVRKNDKVKWKWDATNTNTHNVVLTKGPKGVKKGCPTKGKDAYSPLISKCNKSGAGAIGIKFTKKMDVKGEYRFLCTFHPTVMKMTVKVGK